MLNSKKAVQDDIANYKANQSPNPKDQADLRIALTQLTGFAARQSVLYIEGKPLEGNVTDEENKFLALIAQRETTARQIGTSKEKLEVIEALKDIIVHSAPDGTQDDGDFIGFYVLPTGPIHRGIATLQNIGESVRPMGDVSVISRYQAHLASRETTARLEELSRIEQNDIGPVYTWTTGSDPDLAMLISERITELAHLTQKEEIE